MSEKNAPQRPRSDDKPDASAYTEGSMPEPFSTVGASEDEEANRNQEVAPGFTDMEPGAGPDYGPSGEPGSAATEDPNRLTSPGFTAPEVTGETQKRPKPGEEWNEVDDTPASS
ncbi:MAG TPA: hypothetical protein VGP82_10435 [Ktedonobacterales bacterium]|jgi:hypothetical protein|nr:hypothetical protein [Ktedonobacterales bacterium]